jgi:hypothetical protein
VASGLWPGFARTASRPPSFHRRLFDENWRMPPLRRMLPLGALRQGKDSHKARAGRERSYQGQRYCSATCRKLASKARRARLGTPVLGPVLKATTRLGSPEGSRPFSGVTNAPNPINLAIVSGASESTPYAASNDLRRLYRYARFRMACDVPRPQAGRQSYGYCQPNPCPRRR